jgi:glycosyltransferase involved in cell wall biosynthesis
MACILRLPSAESVGVLSITTQERNQIHLEPALRAELLNLKSHWMIGLHHNWHDFNFKYDSLFDFSFAGEGDLREINDVQFDQIKFDACNFVPSVFFPSVDEKFWDLLYVARAVYFKRIPEFFTIIRKLFDSGHRLRVLFICPVPPYSRGQKSTAFYNIREEYDRLFNEDEKSLFTLMTTNYRYPFPFDLDTLAYFYRASKVFVHTADDERRCRVAAYAWATGMPVVCMEQVASLMPKDYRVAPMVYVPKTYEDFPVKIMAALDSVAKAEVSPMAGSAIREFRESDLLKRLDAELEVIAQNKERYYVKGQLFGKNLGLRLGRHHDGVDGPNSFPSNLMTLVKWISLADLKPLEYVQEKDLEVFINAQVMNYYTPTPKFVTLKAVVLIKFARLKSILYPIKKLVFRLNWLKK